jgi:hypothetical protein
MDWDVALKYTIYQRAVHRETRPRSQISHAQLVIMLEYKLRHFTLIRRFLRVDHVSRLDTCCDKTLVFGFKLPELLGSLHSDVFIRKEVCQNRCKSISEILLWTVSKLACILNTL